MLFNDESVDKLKIIILMYYLKQILLAAFVLFVAVACRDEVDESDMYTFKGETAYSFLQKTSGYQKYAYLLTKVKLSKKSPTSVADLLSARGNYTVFAPRDSAVQYFLDSVYQTKDYDINQIPDSMAQAIVENSIINNGNDEAYRTPSFVVGVLSITNMADRYLQVSYGTKNDGSLETKINVYSKIIQPDQEVANGVVHGLDRVINMSVSTLPDLLRSVGNMRIFSRMLDVTGWKDSLVAYLDEEYEYNHPLEGSIDPGNTAGGEVGPSPEHRFFGYTAFVETDSVFEAEWGIPKPVIVDGNVQNYDEIESAFIEKCKEAYTNATSTDLKSKDNAVNQFVSYHLLPERITFNRLVIHHNEMGYATGDPTRLSIDCYEYYETMGLPRRLMKITEGSQTDGKRINRHATYDDGFFGDYHETSCDRPGILVSDQNALYASNALNGFYYPIDHVLVYDDEVPNKVLNERLRFDFLAICPDLMTNGMRRIEDNRWRFIPNKYLTNWWCTDETLWRYVPYWDSGNYNLQGDEINILGQYDFVFRLPPVPFYGTWELRFCAPEITHFGMFQIYIGTDRSNLQPVGLPLDFRIAASNPVIGWEADTQDLDRNREIDKNMRNHGYMKNCMHDGAPNGKKTVTVPMRAANGDYIRLRKIICAMPMSPDKTYYVRIKSVLENKRTCCMLDYFELVPKNVYNGLEEEDPW